MRLFFVFCFAVSAMAGAKHETVQIKGVKTPGVQIPFSSLKAESEVALPDKPAWVFFEGSAYAPSAKGLDRIDAKTNKPAKPIEGIAKACAGMANGFGSLWVPSCADGTLYRLDAKTYKETVKFAVGTGSAPRAIAASTDSIWVLSDDKATLSRVDPDQNLVVGELRVPAGCRSLIFGETSLWLACPAENKVYRINTATNEVMNQVEVSEHPESLAVGEGSIWAFCRKAGKVDRIDPKTNKVTKSIDLAVPGVAGEIAVGDGSVWVTMAGFPLTRISVTPEKEAVVQQFFGTGGGAIAASAGAIWLSNVAQGTLWKIDPKRVVATLAE